MQHAAGGASLLVRVRLKDEDCFSLLSCWMEGLGYLVPST